MGDFLSWLVPKFEESVTSGSIKTLLKTMFLQIKIKKHFLNISKMIPQIMKLGGF